MHFQDNELSGSTITLNFLLDANNIDVLADVDVFDRVSLSQKLIFLSTIIRAISKERI